MSRTRWLGLVLSLIALPACSALFDGSAYRGGTGTDEDAGRDTDAGPLADGGDGGSAMTDGGPNCDGDGDGFLSDEGPCASVMPMRPRDCDDANPNIYPGALPICGNMVDESCSGGTAAGGLATELGRFAILDVPTAPAVDRQSQLRVFMRPGTESLIFFVGGDADRTPFTVDVDLEEASVDAPEDLRTILGEGGGALVRADAIRLPDRSVVAALFTSGGGQARIARGRYDPAAGTWTSAATVHNLGAFPITAGFVQTGNVALIHRDDDREFVAVAGNSTMVGPGPSLWAFGVGSMTVEPVSMPGQIIMRPWMASSGNAVAFEGPGGQIAFWSGATTLGSTRIALDLTGRGALFPGIASAVRGVSDTNRAAILVPRAGALEVGTFGCTNAQPLHSCPTFGPGTDSPNTYTGLMNGDAPIVAAGTTSSTALLLAQSRMAAGGAEIAISSIETEPLGGTLLQFGLGIPVSGAPFAVALDAMFFPEAKSQGRLEFVLAFFEEEGPARRLRVTGGRACVGYATP